MNNKVVYRLFQGYVNAGYSCLRINFRGVGKSEGAYDNGEGEVTDAVTALEWLQDQTPSVGSITVIGYSFGAWISMQILMRRPEVSNFILVAPAPNMFDFSFLTPCPHPGLFVYGSNDALVPKQEVDALVSKLIDQNLVEIEYQIIQGANHFFQSHEQEVVDTCLAYSQRIAHRTFEQLHKFAVPLPEATKDDPLSDDDAEGGDFDVEFPDE